MTDAEEGRAADRRKHDPLEEQERQRRHRETRGKKKVTLADLSKELPEATIEEILEWLLIESDRSAAIMASAFLENTLRLVIGCNLADWGQTTTQSWFDGQNAPFKSFSAKISLGQAIGVYGPKTAKTLDTVRSIRNCFAHRVMPLDFTHPTVMAACLSLERAPFLPNALTPARTRYLSVCLSWGEKFVKAAFDDGGKTLTSRFP